jgi:FKBP-type peptidyl-prolyl cis-trans isomerase SlyD
MKVAKGLLVRCEYELRVAGGEVLESSEKTGPIVYVQGAGKMLPALESRLDGMDEGEEKRGDISAAEITGDVPDLTVPRSLFPAAAKLEVGARFEAKDPQGRPLQLEVRAIDGDTVSARPIHPLAGKDLAFRIKVLSVRKPPPPVPAKPAELDEGDLVDEA